MAHAVIKHNSFYLVWTRYVGARFARALHEKGPKAPNPRSQALQLQNAMQTPAFVANLESIWVLKLVVVT